MYFIFPPHLTNASALPRKTEIVSIASFHSKVTNAECFFTKITKHSLKYNLATAEPPSTVKTID